jgi:hypothetical protein
MSTRRLILVPVLALSASACDDSFLPPSYLHDLRVLAVVSTPLEAGPGESVTLRPSLYLPPGETLASSRWSFCPYQLGSEAGNRCVDPRCESELPIEADGSIRSEPISLAVACALTLGLTAPSTGTSVPSEPIEAVFRGEYRSSSGLSREAVMRLPLHLLTPPAARNRPPAIASVRLGGEELPIAGGRLSRAARAGDELELEVAVEPGSMDRYLDATGRERTEEPVISFFTTAGRLEHDRLAGLTATTIWRAAELEPGQDRAALFLVVRDLRGGQTVAGPFELSIAR